MARCGPGRFFGPAAAVPAPAIRLLRLQLNGPQKIKTTPQAPPRTVRVVLGAWRSSGGRRKAKIFYGHDADCGQLLLFLNGLY